MRSEKLNWFINFLQVFTRKLPLSIDTKANFNTWLEANGPKCSCGKKTIERFTGDRWSWVCRRGRCGYEKVKKIQHQ